MKWWEDAGKESQAYGTFQDELVEESQGGEAN